MRGRGEERRAAAARAIRDEKSCTAASYARNLTQRDSRAREKAVTGDREKMRDGGVAKFVESPDDSIRVALRLLSPSPPCRCSH